MNTPERQSNIIFVGGLNPGDDRRLEWVAERWNRKYGIECFVFNMDWYSKCSPSFDYNMRKLVAKVDELSQKGPVSLVGLSAGASAVLNAFVDRREEIEHVVLICGRIKRGNMRGIRSFRNRTASSAAFAISILEAEDNLSALTDDDKQKILTVVAGLGDELVPYDTATINGVKIVRTPTFGHVISIICSLTFFSKPVIDFILGRKQDGHR